MQLNYGYAYINSDKNAYAGIDINLDASGNSYATAYIQNNGIVEADQDINLTVSSNNYSSVNIYSNSNLIAGRDINLTNTGNNTNHYISVENYSILNATNDINITAERIKLAQQYSYVTLNAGNRHVFINTGKQLELFDASIYAGNQLTLNAGDYQNYGLTFVPYAGTIEADSLSSDFLTTGGPVDLTSSEPLTIGNLDYLIIGGSPFNPTYISITSDNDAILYGKNTTPGNINLTSTADLAKIWDSYGVNAGGDINITSGSFYAGIDYSRVYADGNIWLNGTYTYVSDGSIVDAGGNILLTPSGFLNIRGGEFIAGDTFTANRGTNNTSNFYFKPNSVIANNLDSDWFSMTGDINLERTDDTHVGGFKNIVINGTPVIPNSIYIEGYNASLSGLVETVGDFNVVSNNESGNAYIVYNSNIKSTAGSIYVSGQYQGYVESWSKLNAYEDIYIENLSTYYGGGSSYIDYGASLTAGNDVVLNNAVNNSYSYLDNYTNVTAGRDVNIGTGNSGAYAITHEYSRITAGRDINFVSNYNSSPSIYNSTLTAGNNINITNAYNTGGYQINSSTLTAEGDITLNVGYANIGQNTVLDAYNINLSPYHRLNLNYASLYADNQLTLNSSNLAERGITFIPNYGSIVAGSLVSNFLTPNAPLNIVSEGSIDIGNLDYITIDGNPLNTTEINLTSNDDNVSLYGDNTIPGDIILTSNDDGSVNVYSSSNIITGGVFNATSYGYDIRIGDNSVVMAQNGINLTVNSTDSNVTIDVDYQSVLDTPVDINLINNSEDGDVIISSETTLTAGHDINILADSIYLNQDSMVDAENNVVINPDNFLYIYFGSINADNQLTLKSGDLTNAGSFTFVPHAGSIVASILDSNFLIQNGPFVINEDLANVNVGNLDYVFIGGAPLNPTEITINTNENIDLYGSSSTTGNIYISGLNIYVNQDSHLIADGNITLSAYDIGNQSNLSIYNSILEAQNIDLNSRYIDIRTYSGDYEISETQFIASNDVSINALSYLRFQEASIDAGNVLTINAGDIYDRGIDFRPFAGTIEAGSLVSNFLVTSGDMTLDSDNSLYIGNLDHIFIGGSQISIDNLTLNSPGDGVYLYGDISVNNNMNIQGDYAYIYQDANLTAGNDINIDTDNIRIYEGSQMTSGNNLYITPVEKLTMYGGCLNATNQLTINSGDLMNRGIYFKPDSGSIYAGSLLSDFMTPGGLIYIESNSTIEVANFDHIYVGGTSAGFTGVNLLSNNGNVYLGGDVTVPGSINLTGRSVNINENANITSGEDVIMTATDDYTYINQYATVHADRDIILDASIGESIEIRENTNVYAGRNFELTGKQYTRIYDNSQVIAGGDILLQNTSESTWGSVEIREDSYIEAGNNLYMINYYQDGGGVYIYNNTQAIAGNELRLDGNYVSIDDNSILNGYDVTLNPYRRLYVENSSIYATNLLTLNSGDIYNYGISFYPAAGTIEAGSLASDFLTPNAPLNITSNSDLYVGNFDHIYIGGNPLGLTSINLNTQGTIYFYGDTTVPGSITASANNSSLYVRQDANLMAGTDINLYGNERLNVRDGANLYAGNDLTLNGGEVIEIENCTLEAGNQLTLYSGKINQYGFEFRPEYANATSLDSNFLTQNGPMIFNSTYGFSAWDNNTGIQLGNLDNVFIGGAALNPTEISISGYPYIALYGNTTTNGNINLNANRIFLYGSNEGKAYIDLFDSSTLPPNSYVGIIAADNMVVNPEYQLFVDGVDLVVNNSLTINSGNMDDYGFTFRPYGISANSLTSDFMSPNGTFNISNYDEHIHVANLDNVFIGGTALNPTGINLDASNGHVYLSGNTTTSGDINLTGNYVNLIGTTFIHQDESEEQANIIIGNNITADPAWGLGIRNIDLNASGQLTVNKGDQDFDYGLFFVPDEINAGSLDSDFLVQNGPLNVICSDSENIGIGNLDHIYIGGNPLNPTGINIQGAEITGLYGDNTVSGDINLEGTAVRIDSIAPEDLGYYGYWDTPEYTFDNSNISDINASNMTVNPELSLFINNVNIKVDNLLTLNGGQIEAEGLYLVPNSIEAGSFASDFLTQDGPITIDITNDSIIDNNPLLPYFRNNGNVAIGNIDHFLIGGNSLNPSSIDINTIADIYLAGNNTTTGELNVVGQSVNIVEDGVFTAGEQDGNVNIEGTEVVLDGTLKAYGGEAGNKYLKINNDGSIDPDSNINATLNGSTMEVDNTIAAGGAQVVINGNLTGTGTIDLYNGVSLIDIINESDYNLLLNGLAIDTDAGSTLEINGEEITSDYNDIAVNFNSSSDGGIFVDNISETDVLLAGDISNTIGLVELLSGGSIYNNTGDAPVIESVDLNLAALGGSIGLSGDAINIDLVACNFNASALNNIFVTEADGNLFAGLVEAGDTVELIVNNGSLIGSDSIVPNIVASDAYLYADGEVALTLDVANSTTVNAYYAAIYGYTGTLDVVTQAGIFAENIVADDVYMYTGGDTAFSGVVLGDFNVASGFITTMADIGGVINLIADDVYLIGLYDLNLGTIEASNDVMVMSMEGDILNANPLGANIIAQNIGIGSINGQIGNEDNHIITDLQASELYAAAWNDIFITELEGDMELGIVETVDGEVVLRTENGSIVNVLDDQTVPNIIANGIQLEANGGSIGTINDDVLVDYVTTSLNATADQDINLTVANGDFNIGTVESVSGGVTLTTESGNILNTLDDTVTPNVAANNILLLANGGSIGTDTDDILINLNTGTLNAAADNDIFITELNGDLMVETVESASGDVTLVAEDGSILNALGDTTTPNVIGVDVTLESNGGSIGTETDDILIDQINCTLNASADDDVYITGVRR